MTKYYEIKALTIEGDDEILFGSFDKTDCKHELDAERRSWKDQGYTQIKITSSDTDEIDQDRPHQHIAIQLWHKGQTTFSYTASVIRLAEEQGAPVDVIYNKAGDQWATIDQITNRDAVERMIGNLRNYDTRPGTEGVQILIQLQTRLAEIDEHAEHVENGNRSMHQLVYNEMHGLLEMIDNDDRGIYHTMDDVTLELAGLKAAFPKIWGQVLTAEFERENNI